MNAADNLSHFKPLDPSILAANTRVFELAEAGKAIHTPPYSKHGGEEPPLVQQQRRELLETAEEADEDQSALNAAVASFLL